MSEPRRLLAVATDLDGTLLNRKHAIPLENLQSLQQLAESGVTVVVATGRMTSCAFPYADEIGPFTYVVSYNGGRAHGPVSNGIRPLLFETKLEALVVTRVVDLCLVHKFHIQAYFGDELFAQHIHPRSKAYIQFYEELSGAKIKIVESMGQFRDCSVNKLLILCEPSEVEGLHDFFRTILSPEDAHLVRGSQYLEFLSPIVNKGKSVARLLRDHVNIDPDHAMAFGDGENDIEFLQAVGYGVCMRNGDSRLKPVAKKISAFTNEENAVTKEIHDALSTGIFRL